MSETEPTTYAAEFKAIYTDLVVWSIIASGFYGWYLGGWLTGAGTIAIVSLVYLGTGGHHA